MTSRTVPRSSIVQNNYTPIARQNVNQNVNQNIGQDTRRIVNDPGLRLRTRGVQPAARPQYTGNPSAVSTLGNVAFQGAPDFLTELLTGRHGRELINKFVQLGERHLFPPELNKIPKKDWINALSALNLTEEQLLDINEAQIYEEVFDQILKGYEERGNEWADEFVGNDLSEEQKRNILRQEDLEQYWKNYDEELVHEINKTSFTYLPRGLPKELSELKNNGSYVVLDANLAQYWKEILHSNISNGNLEELFTQPIDNIDIIPYILLETSKVRPELVALFYFHYDPRITPLVYQIVIEQLREGNPNLFRDIMDNLEEQVNDRLQDYEIEEMLNEFKNKIADIAFEADDATILIPIFDYYDDYSLVSRADYEQKPNIKNAINAYYEMMSGEGDNIFENFENSNDKYQYLTQFQNEEDFLQILQSLQYHLITNTQPKSFYSDMNIILKAMKLIPEIKRSGHRKKNSEDFRDSYRQFLKDVKRKDYQNLISLDEMRNSLLVNDIIDVEEPFDKRELIQLLKKYNNTEEIIRLLNERKINLYKKTSKL